MPKDIVDEVFEEVEVRDVADNNADFEQGKKRRASRKSHKSRKSRKSVRKARTLANGYKRYQCYDANNRRVGGEYVNRSPSGAARKGANAMRRAGGKARGRVSVVQLSTGRNNGVRYDYSSSTKEVPASDFVRENSGRSKMLQTTVKRI